MEKVIDGENYYCRCTCCDREEQGGRCVHPPGPDGLCRWCREKRMLRTGQVVCGGLVCECGSCYDSAGLCRKPPEFYDAGANEYLCADCFHKKCIGGIILCHRAFAQMLQHIMERKGWTHEDLARQVGVKKEITVLSWLYARQFPTRRTMTKLVKIFDEFHLL